MKGSVLITPDELPIWVPGDLTLDSVALPWEGMRMRGYRYAPSDVPIPPLKDLLLVVYKNSATPMHRRCDGPWREDQMEPGTISFLSHAIDSHWRWSEAIEVQHLYLDPQTIARVASDLYQRDVDTVSLRDVLRADDPVLSGMVADLAWETQESRLGSRLYVDALQYYAYAQILRRYADVTFRVPVCGAGLSAAQRRLVVQYIEDNLSRAVSLAELAGVARLSVFHFTRKFRSEFGCPPHAYLMQRRLEAAKRQLAQGHIPIKVIAAECGFSDQSHMTRIFRRFLKVTPLAYRQKTTC